MERVWCACRVSTCALFVTPSRKGDSRCHSGVGRVTRGRLIELTSASLGASHRCFCGSKLVSDLYFSGLAGIREKNEQRERERERKTRNGEFPCDLVFSIVIDAGFRAYDRIMYNL